MSEESITMEKIVSLAKRRGFIFQSSDIYGGLGSVYDYGPLGVLLKNNIQQAWWKSMVQENQDVVGLDAGILMHQKVWEASGHVASFSDPLVDCKKCKLRHRADKLLGAMGVDADDKMTIDEINTLLKDNKAVCPDCGGALTEARSFNLMLKTHLGPVESDDSVVYLRPETAQGIYVNFKNVQQSMRKKVPFGIAQIGKAFRNEITTKQFIFRTREFTQMEMQYFVHPDDAGTHYEDWKERRMRWFIKHGVNKDKLRYHKHDKLAHYAKSAYDIEYEFPSGWDELEGLHNRGDFDLSQHQEYSKEDLQYQDPETKEKYTPYIIETSVGLDRATLAFLLDAYSVVEGGRGDGAKSDEEVVLKLHKSIAPIKVAILPLSKKPELQKVSEEITHELQQHWMVQYDETGSIGKRYRRQDEIGTPYCITVDFDTSEDKAVTIRDRDTMEQERIKIEELAEYLRKNLQ